MKKLFIAAFALLVGASSLFAQNNWSVSDGALLDGKTIVKVNLTGLALRNFGFYGERIINNRFSAVLGVNFMPKGGIPFASSFNKVTEQDVEGTLNNLKVNTFSLTPEIRIYTGSGYGKGFYVAPYFKYETFGLTDLSVTFNDHDGAKRQVDMDGKLATYSGGLMIGYQWLIGKNKNFVLDWSIVGAHYGSSSGNIHGYVANGMTEQEQTLVRDNLEGKLKDIPMIKYTIAVDAKNANVDLKGPWAFFRMGISVGYRF